MADLIVLLGPPGAGKGTQAKVLSQKLSLAHISSGDLFRDHLQRKTELGILAQGYMQRGELVPDNVTISMIRERMQENRIARRAPSWTVFRGRCRRPKPSTSSWPIRNSGAVRKAPYIKVDAQVLVDRLSGRWSCRAGGHVYHEKFNPPKAAGQVRRGRIGAVSARRRQGGDGEKPHPRVLRTNHAADRILPPQGRCWRRSTAPKPIDDVTGDLLASVK